MSRNGPELEQVVHTFQQIVSERFGRRGFGAENTIYVRTAVYFSRIFNMAAYKDFSWTDDELDLLLRCSLVYKSNTEL